VASPAPRTITSAVRAYARRHGIFRPGPLVVAVSGGTDSTALALIVAELREEFGLVLHVAHFDHRARPRASAADAAFVAALADQIGAPIRVGRAERAPKSEEDARDARYAFLRRVATDIGATAIATGHTLDDQAETVLLHLTRGSGIAGAAGMRPLRDGIARPLLGIGRGETTAICRAAKIRPREDRTNASLLFARNRVRLKVLPELARINPQIRSALARFADAAAGAEDRASGGTELTADSRGTARGASSEWIDIAALPAAHAARGRALAELAASVSGREIGSRHRDALLDLASSAAGTRRIDLPGATAIREYARLRIEPRAGDTSTTTPRAGGTAASGATGPTALTRGATIEWHGWRIALDAPTDGLPFTAVVDAVTASRLAVRSRRPGDRVAGHGKLQDVFVDAKVPARLRDTWPVFTLNEKVVWVPGLTRPLDVGNLNLSVGPTPMKGVAVLTENSYDRRVASKSETRPTGGKKAGAEPR
jgi:tRNA(Ile)-lysidine synthase